MPIMDSQLLLCKELDISGVATTVTVSTNVIDLGVIYNHVETAIDDPVNENCRLFFNVVVEGAALLAGTDGSVVTAALYNDSDDVPTTGGTVICSKSVTANTPTEHPDGTFICCIPLPLGPLKRYLGAAFPIATQTLSTGKVTAWIGSKQYQG